MYIKKIYLMNSPELPTPGTHLFTTNKFLSGFTYYGYEKLNANNLDDIEDGSIVLLSNHGLDHPIISKEVGLKALNYLADKYPNCIYICWFYHAYYDTIPFKRFIITGEHFHFKPRLDTHIKRWDIQQKINNYVPLTFASPLLPEQIESYERNDILNGCFMGTAYKRDWVAGLPKTVFLTGINHGKEIKEDDRIKLFLSSKIAFGFHHNDNVLNNVVVERVFEGMAYGCVVISDSPAAGLITNGIVQVANNKQEFLEIYNKILSDDNMRLDLQKRGYEWVKNNGLYIHTVKKFIDKFTEL
jgi:hypothetical protein